MCVCGRGLGLLCGVDVGARSVFVLIPTLLSFPPLQVPDELGKLEQLEELNLNENLLESIPTSLALCPVLRSLKLQNNKLKTIPFELSGKCVCVGVNVAGLRACVNGHYFLLFCEHI